MKKACISGAVVFAALVMASCGDSSSSTDSTVAMSPTAVSVQPKYAAFCKASTALDAAMGGTHGEDPTAITDPTLMKEAWSNIATLSETLRDLSPQVVKSDASTMVNSVLAIDAIFKANDYDLLAMAKDEDVRTQLAKLSSDSDLAESSKKFNTFLVANCGKVIN
jgi:hypothetical protein